MSRLWKPSKPTVELQPEVRPSRIRRDPLRTAPAVQPKPRNRERELWLGVGGIVATAIACAIITVGISQATSLPGIGAAAQAPPEGFQHCYNAAGADCVRDGDTIRIGGEMVELAFDAPETSAAQCAEERRRGIEAATRLRDLLNAGEVTLTAPVRQADGQLLRNVEVDGEDAGRAMIAAGLAREYGSSDQGWC